MRNLLAIVALALLSLGCAKVMSVPAGYYPSGSGNNDDPSPRIIIVDRNDTFTLTKNLYYMTDGKSYFEIYGEDDLGDTCRVHSSIPDLDDALEKPFPQYCLGGASVYVAAGDSLGIFTGVIPLWVTGGHVNDTMTGAFSCNYFKAVFYSLPETGYRYPSRRKARYYSEVRSILYTLIR